MKITHSIVWCSVGCLILSTTGITTADPLREARVSQVVQDVRLMGANAASRQAAVNDNVRLGTAVRTGSQSRAELTFQDLTITRLGENTIFSLKEGTRDLTLEHGSILLEVPPGAPKAVIQTAAVSAAVTGGTAMFGTGPPAKFMVLEGVGTFYPVGHPEEALTLHGGEMATFGADGRPIVQTFNVKAVMESSHLVVDFPNLANLPLILDVETYQDTSQSSTTSSSSSTQTTVDQTSQAQDAGAGGTQSGSTPPSEFGPPPTITSPDPYQLGSGSAIQTDPTITTNGVTDQGTLYRGTAQDGTPTQFLFGETATAFDENVFGGPQNNLPIAVFKFSDLQLTGDATVTVPSGATTNLALVSVGNITSGSPGGTLTFAGIQRLDFITQNGSINLGSEISFSGIDHLSFYARGAGNSLTLASAISGGSVVKLYSEGDVTVNGSISASSDFLSLSEGTFNATGSNTNVSANNIGIVSLNGDINIDASKFPNPSELGGSFSLNAANNLNITLAGGGTFGWDTLTATATTINLTGKTTFDFSNSSSVTFTAGTGGIQASTINFFGSNLTMMSDGDINIGSFESPANDQGGNIPGGTINAAGAVTSTGNITNTTHLIAGTSISIGGNLATNDVTAGTTINVGGNIYADTVTAGGNIDSGGQVKVITINAPTSVLTASFGIIPVVLSPDGAALQHTFNVDSIVAPDGGIDFDGNWFNGINGSSAGGRLTINATTITFDAEIGIEEANFNGAQAGFFGGGLPSEGGDGGIFIVNTTGDINVDNGSQITATTGYNSDSGVYSGAGGSVTLHSSGGMVTVDDLIQVSSDDAKNQQQSASGGTILVQSDLTTGQGITIGSAGQLLSLLDVNAPGPGGSITLSTMGANITVNGTLRADFGTITIDQNDPPGTTPTITLDGSLVQASTFNINGAGDLIIAPNFTTSINILGGTWNVAHDITLNVPFIGFANSFALNATAGNAINFIGGNSGSPGTLELPLSGVTTFTAGAGGINSPYIAIVNSGASLNLISGGDITAYAIIYPGYAAGTIAANGGALTVTADLQSGNVSALTNINVGGDVLVSTLNAGTTIQVGGRLAAFESVTAGGNITANTIAVPNITTPGVLTAGIGGIHPFIFSADPSFLAQGAKAPHVFNVDSIVSPNGIDFSGNQFNGILGYSSGGILTINANTITFDPSTGIEYANFNGAQAGSFYGGGPSEGGDGGTFVVNTTGDINVNNGSEITATTGYNSAQGVYSGTGGSVTLHSSGGSVVINDLVEVSSNDVSFQRQSASGGTILVQSDLTTGTGITIGNTGQLLSPLGASAPGSGGSITLSTMGADITISPEAVIEADRGTITIDQTDPVNSTPFITIDGATLISDTLTITGAGNVNIGSEVAPFISANTLSITAPGEIQFFYNYQLPLNEFTVTSTNGGDVTLQFDDVLTLNGNATFQSSVPSGVTINSGANISFTDYEDYVNNSQTDFSLFQVTNLGHIINGGNVTVDISGNLTTTGPGTVNGNFEAGDFVLLMQNTNGQIDTGGNASLSVSGSANVNGLVVLLQNYDFTANPAGHIGTGGNIDVEINGDLNANHYVEVFLNNRGGGTIDSGGNLTFNVGGDINIGSEGAEFAISNRYDDVGGNTSPSMIGSSVALYLHAADFDMAGDLFFSGISNHGGSTINGNATATWDITGNLTIQGTGLETWQILNDTLNPLTDPGAHLTTPVGGTINGNATLALTVGGDVNLAGDASIEITNQRNGASTAANGGSINGNAAINVSAADFSVGGELDVEIFNNKGGAATGSGGSITGDATISFNVAGNFAMPGTDTNGLALFGVPGGAFFEIRNFRGGASGTGGVIGGDALIDVEAGSIGTPPGPTAELGIRVAELEADIQNFNGGTINGNATVQIGTTVGTSAGSGGNIYAGTLLASIDNRNGTIGGDATINMNVGRTAIATNVTAQILGNNPAGTAAINFNGGTYSVANDFRTTIDGSGVIKFANANISANTIKAGVFGTDGTLMIGGGSMTANQLLHLYATGSSGSIEFTSNITLTLNSASNAIILAANQITIDQGVVVTISGAFAASVYANIANYSSAFGGNDTTGTYGTFAGKGATTQPLGGQPGFDNSSIASTTAKTGTTVASSTAQSSSSSTVASTKSGSGVTSRGLRSPISARSTHNMTNANTSSTPNSTVKAANSGELLSVLDSATPNSNGKITISSSKTGAVGNHPGVRNPNQPGATHSIGRDRTPTEKPAMPVALVERGTPSLR